MATGPGGFSFSSFLDQYESTGATRATPGQSATSNSSANGRSSDIRMNAEKGRNGSSPNLRKERPAPIGVPGKALSGTITKSNTASPLNTFTPPISRALDAAKNDEDAGEKKRKLEENANGVPAKRSRFEGMTKEQKVAEIKRLKALKAAKDAAKANGASTRDGTGSGSAASNPNSPITSEAPRKPAKGSYAEIMERAKQLQATATPPAKIIHKERKVEKKKIAKPDKPELGKKPIIRSSALQSSKGSAPSSLSRTSPVKKAPVRPNDTKKQQSTRPVESKLKVQPIEWKGTARPSATAAAAKPPSSKAPSRPLERERERGDRSRSWERERERERYRSPVKKYRYAESEEDEDDYESESDMEATGIDILEEEEYSRKKAVLEDLEAERLEKELAAKKKKQIVGRR